jgi:meso-butanediol dehydrogenase/(S,S)-butanediol dehydrogenase/diacetyl reductase
VVGLLSGKVAIVTGGGRGIGRGIADRFLAEGAGVMIAQRNAPDAALLAADGPIAYHRTDMASARSIAELVPATLSRFGRLDVLVNNAGIVFELPVEETGEDDWDRLLTVNLKGPFLLIKSAAIALRASGRGSIINISSIEGGGANPLHAAYCASKAGLEGLTRAVAVDLGRSGIRCNAIAPGWIDTEMSAAFIDSLPDREAYLDRVVGLHPVGRLGTPHDIGNLAVWLASELSSFVTGQTYVVDGGRTTKLPLPG